MRGNMRIAIFGSGFLAGLYLFNLYNGSVITMCGIRPKLLINTPEIVPGKISAITFHDVFKQHKQLSYFQMWLRWETRCKNCYIKISHFKAMHRAVVIFCLIAPFVTILILFALYYLYCKTRNAFRKARGVIIWKSYKENEDFTLNENSCLTYKDKNKKEFGCCGVLHFQEKLEFHSNRLFLKSAARVLFTLELTHFIDKNETVKNSCCSICLDEFNVNEEIICLSCSHGFHESCIFDLAKIRNYNSTLYGSCNCPLCNVTIHFKDLSAK